jgi:hypothetical protein
MESTAMNLTRLVWTYDGERTGIFRGIDDFTSSDFADAFTAFATEMLPVPIDTDILPILMRDQEARWFFTDRGMSEVGTALLAFLRDYEPDWFDHDEPNFPRVDVVNLTADPTNILYEDEFQVLLKGDVYNEGIHQP